MRKFHIFLVFTILLVFKAISLHAYYIDTALGNQADEVKTAWSQAGAYSSNGGVENYTELSNQNHKLS
jgi:hypothetical protein